jgi:TolB-like protein/Tfp pilus assembly protein PilF
VSQQSQHTDNARKIGEWTIQPDRLRLVLGDRSVTLQPRSMDTLMCLVQRPGEVVSADELISAVWGRTVVEDGAVYQTIAKLRKALDDDPHHPKYIETIPKKGYRLIAEVRDAEPSPPSSATGETRRWSRTHHAAVVAAALIAGAALLFTSSRLSDDAPTPEMPAARTVSIAVLPFEDMSEDESQAYLGDGIAEELIHTLTHQPGIRVVARTSSFSMRDQRLDVTAIAERLGVDVILEGSIRRSDDTLWITAQLVDGSNGLHVWSEKYERSTRDIFSVQEDIARHVAGIIRDSSAAVPSVDRRDAPDPEAYERYLLGRHQAEMRTRESLDRSIRHLEEAVSIDGEFAQAFAEIARAYFLASDLRYGTVPEAVAIERARTAAGMAVELNPGLPDGWVESARLATYESDLAAAESLLQRAISINDSDPRALTMLGDLRASQGSLTEAVVAYEKATEMDPLSARRHLGLGQGYRRQGLYDQAEERYRIAVEINPAWPTAWNVGANFFMEQGRLPESIRWAARGATVGKPGERFVQSATFLTGYGWFMLEERAWAEAWFERARALSPDEEQFFVENGWIHVLLSEDRDQEAHELLARLAAGDKAEPGVFALGGLYEMMMGHDAHALAMYERATDLPADDGAGEMRGNLFGNGPAMFGYLPALNLSTLYREQGRIEEADALLEDARAFLAEQPDLGGQRYLQASIAALEGERGRAIRLLGRAVEAGWVRRWYLERDPNLASIRDDPQVTELLDDMWSLIADMRADLQREPGDSMSVPGD